MISHHLQGAFPERTADGMVGDHALQIRDRTRRICMSCVGEIKNQMRL
jgi:hypothetical protein